MMQPAGVVAMGTCKNKLGPPPRVLKDNLLVCLLKKYGWSILWGDLIFPILGLIIALILAYIVFQKCPEEMSFKKLGPYFFIIYLALHLYILVFRFGRALRSVRTDMELFKHGLITEGIITKMDRLKYFYKNCYLYYEFQIYQTGMARKVRGKMWIPFPENMTKGLSEGSKVTVLYKIENSSVKSTVYELTGFWRKKYFFETYPPPA